MSKLPDEAFRDTIGTIDDEGNRKFIFPKRPSGRFWEYRKWVSYFLLIILIANPFIKVNGNQFMMFNILERRFNIFGFPFWPQDIYIIRALYDSGSGICYLVYGYIWTNILWMDLPPNHILRNGFPKN